MQLCPVLQKEAERFVPELDNNRGRSGAARHVSWRMEVEGELTRLGAGGKGLE